jgi:integrase
VEVSTPACSNCIAQEWRRTCGVTRLVANDGHSSPAVLACRATNRSTASRLRRYIRSRPPDAASDHVFVSLRRGRSGEYEPLQISGLEQMVRELARTAGIRRRVWPHMFRHTYITFLLQRGVDATKIRRVVGHANTQLIGRVYGHLLEHDLADSVLAALAPDAG